MAGFTPDDRAALERADEVRRAAVKLVEELQAALPSLFASNVGLRVSKLREDSDRVGVFFFLPQAGNSWCGVVLRGSSALSFRFEARGDAVVPLRAVQAGLVRDGGHFAGELSLIDETDPLGAALNALEGWTRAL